MYLLVSKQLVIMALIVMAGFVFARAFKAGENEQKFLSKLLLFLINPCLVFNSFNLDFDLLKLKQLGFVAFVSLVVTFVLIVVATSFTHTKNADEKTRDYNHIDRLAVVFTNCGFIGIPLIRGVFGDEGVFYLMGYLVVFNVLLWTYGYYEMCGKINLRKIISNPNIIAVCAGIVLFCLPFRIPVIIAKPVSMIGDLNTATAMVLIGVMFADFQFEVKYLARLIKTVVLRLIVCSAINLFVVWGCYKLFGNMPNAYMMLFVVYICSMCPSATSVPSMSCLFGKDTSYASLLVSITSLVCIITIPVFVALAENLLQLG